MSEKIEIDYNKRTYKLLFIYLAYEHSLIWKSTNYMLIFGNKDLSGNFPIQLLDISSDEPTQVFSVNMPSSLSNRKLNMVCEVISNKYSNVKEILQKWVEKIIKRYVRSMFLFELHVSGYRSHLPMPSEDLNMALFNVYMNEEFFKVD